MPNSFKQDKYKLLVEAANDIIYEVDAHGKFTYLNPRVREVTGYDEEEIIGKSFLSFVREDWRERTLAFYQDQIKHSVPSTYFEFPCISKNGKELWLGQNVQLIENEVVIEGFVAIARNITERYKSQILLRQSEEKYRGIIENLQFGLMEVDLNDRVVYVNKPMCILTGYTQEELIGNVASDLLVSDTTRKVIDEEHTKRNEGAATVYEIQLNHKDGSPRWALISGAPIYDADGNIRGSIGIHMDITQKKKSEEVLKNTRDELEKQNFKLQKKQQYLNAINSFVTKLLEDETIDEIAWEIAENVIEEFGFEDCVIYLCSDELGVCVQQAAYGPKMEKNRSIADPITIPFGKGIVGTVALTGKAEIVADTRSDDRYILDDQMRLSEMAVPIIADDKVIGVIDSEHHQRNFYTKEHLDTITTVANLAANRLKNAIAKQKQLEAEAYLKENERKLRSILDSAIDGVITIDEKGEVIDWNKSAEAIFGYKASEVFGKSLTRTIIPPEYRDAHSAGMKHYKKTGEGPVLHQKIEISAMRKNGEQFPIELAIIPVKSKGVTTFTAFVSDITVQKNVQEEMEKALVKERELNELKSRFVNLTSHEFRTPLTTIKQNTDLISFKFESLYPGEEPVLDKYVKRIDGEIDRLSGLLNDLLLFGKIESGKVEVHRKHLEVEAIFKNVVKRISSNQTGRSFGFKTTGVPHKVNADPKLLDHVLTNLVSNAFKYSQGRKDPEFTLSFNEIGKVRFHIKDHGIGIPQKDQRNLFQSFYRATNVQNIQGSGLGLSIAKEFTEMHNGHIDVSSIEDVGTEFIVEIPY